MIPKQWSVVILQVDPHIGREIGGHRQLSKQKFLNLTIQQYLQYCRNQTRPMLVISNNLFNRSGIIECMPIMTHDFVGRDGQIVDKLKASSCSRVIGAIDNIFRDAD